MKEGDGRAQLEPELVPNDSVIVNRIPLNASKPTDNSMSTPSYNKMQLRTIVTYTIVEVRPNKSITDESGV